MIGDVILYGDPHGEWEPLLRSCADDPPVAVILLGDCDLEKPLREQLQPVFENGISVFWIPGNHDCDSEECYDRLFGDYPAGNIHAKAVQIDKTRWAGLGGVFKARIWYPRTEETAPMHANRKSYLRTVPRAERWRGGLRLAAIDGIFPEDVEALGRTRADVLVTHEAPSCHKYGFVGIDMAAAACRARLVVHGHHHESYEARIGNDRIRVRGLGRAEVFRLGQGEFT